MVIIATIIFIKKCGIKSFTQKKIGIKNRLIKILNKIINKKQEIRNVGIYI